MCIFESGSGSILDVADFGGLTVERKYTLGMVLIVIKGGEPVTSGECPNLQNGQNKIRTLGIKILVTSDRQWQVEGCVFVHRMCFVIHSYGMPYVMPYGYRGTTVSTLYRRARRLGRPDRLAEAAASVSDGDQAYSYRTGSVEDGNVTCEINWRRTIRPPKPHAL